MNLKTAIANGKALSKEANGRKIVRNLNRPITTKTFELAFRTLFEESGYGISNPLTKMDWGMLKNFISNLRREGWTDDNFRDFIHRLFEEWDAKLAGKDFKTANGKKATMPLRPSVRAILICRAEVLSVIFADSFPDSEEDLFILPR